MKSDNKWHSFFILILLSITANTQANCPYCEWAESKYICGKCTKNIDQIKASLERRLKAPKKPKKEAVTTNTVTGGEQKSTLSALAKPFVSAIHMQYTGKATSTQASINNETRHTDSAEADNLPKDEEHSPTSNTNIKTLIDFSKYLRKTGSLLDSGTNWTSMLMTAFGCARFKHEPYSFWIHNAGTSHWIMVNITPDGYTTILNYNKKLKKSFKLVYCKDKESTFRQLYIYLREAEDILAGYI